MSYIEQTPGETCNSCTSGLPVLAPVEYEIAPGVTGTYFPGACADCADESIASDLWKDENGSRPRFDRADLLAWYRALPVSA